MKQSLLLVRGGHDLAVVCVCGVMRVSFCIDLCVCNKLDLGGALVSPDCNLC